jgi:hypothetical protein
MRGGFLEGLRHLEERHLEGIDVRKERRLRKGKRKKKKKKDKREGWEKKD